MDVFIKDLIQCGFRRNKVVFDLPIVVLAVPGAGKTSSIRRLLREDSRFEAWTFGVPDHHNCSGRFIKGVTESSEPNPDKFLIVDEFQRGDWEKFKPFAIFGDVAQLMLKNTASFDSVFSKCASHRFPLSVAKLLQELDFEITSEREGVLQIKDLLGSEPQGVVTCFESEVCDLLDYNQVDHKNPTEVIGLEFPIVSLVISGRAVLEVHRAEFYICCTRATDKLIIISPEPEQFHRGSNAIDSTS
uniref:TBG1 n=1 Tax=Alfalfa latent virus TaxID=165250 RepID=Q913Z8_9VIRU|nr:TBG1 [Alfalfa latent virus]